MVENRLVLDASVVAKWLFEDEDDANKALKIKNLLKDEKTLIFVTSNFYFEICNIVFRKIPSMALQFLMKLKASNIIEYKLKEGVALMAFELMQKYPKISFYDASYHAIAIYENGKFITADKRYYETTKKEKHIILLKNF